MVAFNSIILFTLLGLTAAEFTCDATKAMTLEQMAENASGSTSGSTSGSSSGSTPLDSCVGPFIDCPFCKQDPSGALCGDWYRTKLQDGLNQVVAGKRSLQSRATSLECADGNMCMVAGGVFICAEPSSLDFKDSNGGSGNLDSDIYTMSNGDATSVASTATAFPTPAGSGTKGTATAAVANATPGNAVSGSGSGNKEGSVASEAGNIKGNGLFGLAFFVMGVAVAIF